MPWERKLPQAPRISLAVTQEMIDHAVPKDSGHCMVADAVRAAVPTATYVSVDLQTIRFSDPGKGLRFTYLTPRTVAEALCAWDEGTKPEPWTFQLRSGQVTRSGNRSSKYDSKRREQRKAAEEEEDARQSGAEGRARLVSREGPNSTSGVVPDIVGGTPPPMGALAHGPGIKRNRRRVFGLRALELQPPGETLQHIEQKDHGRS